MYDCYTINIINIDQGVYINYDKLLSYCFLILTSWYSDYGCRYSQHMYPLAIQSPYYSIIVIASLCK